MNWFLSQHSETELENILDKYKAIYEGDSRADIEEEFVADAIGGMFSTEDGVQDFLNWLQEESGYNANEKKTILQRITEWLSDIIEAIRDIMNSGELNGAGKLFAKENCDELTKIRKMFLEALDGAGVNYREGGAVEGDVRNSIKDKRITKGMSDSERANILKNKHIKNIPSVKNISSENIKTWEDIDKLFGANKRNVIHKVAREFGVFKEYINEDVSLIFEFTHNNFRETYGKQKKNFKSFAKLFSVFDQVIENAVGVEIHNRNKDGYKPDVTLKNVYVLLSAFEDGNSIVPVKLAVKEFKDKSNKLYVAIALETIKKTEVSKQGNTSNGVTQSSRSVNISIPDLVSKIKPKDIDLLKYIPNQLLSEEQIRYKNDALGNTETGKIKYSLKQSLDWVDWEPDYVSPTQKSLAKQVTELEKINEDLRLQIRHPGQRHITMQILKQNIFRYLCSYLHTVPR